MRVAERVKGGSMNWGLVGSRSKRTTGRRLLVSGAPLLQFALIIRLVDERSCDQTGDTREEAI